jgi:hypothetical protein
MAYAIAERLRRTGRSSKVRALLSPPTKPTTAIITATNTMVVACLEYVDFMVISPLRDVKH